MKAEAGSNGRDVTSFFSRDHRAIDGALARFRQETAAERALPRLDAFERMLRRHIRWEEDVLFPAFHERLGAEAGACVGSMRLQHDELELRIAELRRAVSAGFPSRRNAQEVLDEALRDHNHAEEGFVYPWMDGVFTAVEKRALLEALSPDDARE